METYGGGRLRDGESLKERNDGRCHKRKRNIPYLWSRCFDSTIGRPTLRYDLGESVRVNP